MIQEQQKLDVELAANLIESNFSIDMSPKMFKTLSENLYSDKVAAIIRELGTNAYDSHIAASKHIPFDVHLPTAIEPHFSIRDYGIGMSEEDVINTYTVYGRSDVAKVKSNDYVGCFGLGSKSIFAYGEKTATLECYLNGTHTIYSLHLSKDGIPCYSKITTCTTNEPNGVKITIPIVGDILGFVEKAKSIYSYFKIIPNSNIEIKPVSYKFSGSTFGYHGMDKLNLVMGNVAYGQYIYGDLYPLRGFDLFFDIGDLNVEAGREKISEETLKSYHFSRKIKTIEKEISRYINLNKFSSTKEAIDFYKKYSNLYSRLGVDAIFKGRDIAQPFQNTFDLVMYTGGKRTKYRKQPRLTDDFYIHDTKSISPYTKSLNEWWLVPENRSKDFESFLGFNLPKLSSFPKVVIKKTKNTNKRYRIISRKGGLYYKNWTNDTPNGYYITYDEYKSMCIYDINRYSSYIPNLPLVIYLINERQKKNTKLISFKQFVIDQLKQIPDVYYSDFYINLIHILVKLKLMDPYDNNNRIYTILFKFFKLDEKIKNIDKDIMERYPLIDKIHADEQDIRQYIELQNFYNTNKGKEQCKA